MTEWTQIKRDYEEIGELPILDSEKVVLFQIVMAGKQKAEELLKQDKEEATK